ncbi:MAG: indolepyruvate ferredoxin oxidoreductase subunit alpha [Armatimonadia bacterium]
MSGNEAIARGAWEAGCSFGSAYPGTPSSEILPALTKLGGAYTEWAPNEKGALESAAGASLTGARCLVTMKHVGVNVAADPLFTLSYMGVTGGLVIVCADDPHMHSSQNEQDSRQYARAAKIPMLEPADTQEALDFTKLAFELSERFDTPVILRVTTRLSHSDGVVEINDRQERPAACEPEKNAEKCVMIPVRARARRKLIAERTAKLRELGAEASFNRTEPGDKSLGIVSSGIAYQYAREVAPEASFLKLGLTWPLPADLIRRFAQSVDRLVVIEELDPFLTEQVRALGLTVEELPETLQIGELSPARVRAALSGEDFIAQPRTDLPGRPPQLCAGCPHRGVFHTLRKLRLLVTGDIGCYTLGTTPPLQALHTCLCMGAGIGMVHGINQACGSKQKAVAVIGDSTFMHSGLTGLLNIAYNQSPSVVIILDNSTTAMTGGQDHPGTGVTMAGQTGGRVDLPALCRATGIENVTVFNPADLAQTESVIREAVDSEGPAVLIARRPCILISRERGAAFAIDEELCIQCGACLRLGCPAISAYENAQGKRQPVIDATMCTGCSLCAQVCPKQAIAQP